MLPVFAASTDTDVRIVGAAPSGGGKLTIAASTDSGATWHVAATANGASAVRYAVANVPGGGIIVATGPGTGLFSADGLTWTAAATGHAPALG